MCRIAAIVILSIGPIERLRVYVENKMKSSTRNLAATIEKSGLRTFGIYDRSPHTEKAQDDIDGPKKKSDASYIELH